MGDCDNLIFSSHWLESLFSCLIFTDAEVHRCLLFANPRICSKAPTHHHTHVHVQKKTQKCRMVCKGEKSIPLARRRLTASGFARLGHLRLRLESDTQIQTHCEISMLSLHYHNHPSVLRQTYTLSSGSGSSLYGAGE